MCGKGGGKCRCGGVSGAQVKKAATPQIQASKGGSSPKLGSAQEIPCKVKSPPKPKPVTYSISGVVRDPLGIPMAGASVTFNGQPAQPPVTGPDGAYRFVDLPANSIGNVTVTLGDCRFVPASHAVPALLANVVGLDFAQATYAVTCKLTASGGGIDLTHFHALLASAKFVITGDHAEEKPGGDSGSCSFGPLPSGKSYQVKAKLGDVEIAAGQPIAALTQTMNLTFAVETCRVYGIVEKLLEAEAEGCSLELQCNAAVTRISLLPMHPKFEFLAVPKGFKYTLTANRAGFTIPAKTIPLLSQDTECNPIVQVFTLNGSVTFSGGGIGQVDIQVTGPRNLTGTLWTGADGRYTVELPKAPGTYSVTPVKADHEFDPPRKDGIKEGAKAAAAIADFKQASYNIRVTLLGGDLATQSFLKASSGMVGLGINRINEFEIKLSNRKAVQKPKVGSNFCQFQSVPKGAALTVALGNAPPYLQCPPVAVGVDGNATLTATLLSFTIGGRVRKWDGVTGVTSDFSPLQMRLLRGSQVLQTVPTLASGAFAFAAVPAAGDYEVVPGTVETPFVTFKPTGALQTEGYRTHLIKCLDANIVNCDFMAMRCTVGGDPPNELGAFYINPGQKAVLSAEMVKNLRGDRGGSHKVRLDFLREALLFAMNNAGQATEAAWKKLYVVTLSDGTTLNLVFGNKTIPSGPNDFIGNVVTAYHSD